jgi:excisionase family DNA binding protein
MTNDRFQPSSLLTTSEVGDLLAVHPSTVKRWCNDGDLAFHKTEGGHRRILLSDTLEFAAQRGIPTVLEPFSPFEAGVWAGLNAVLGEDSFSEVRALAYRWLTEGNLDLITALFVMLGRNEDIPLPRLFDEGVAGFMRLVGEGWRKADLRVADEHLASQAIVEALTSLSGPTAAAAGTASSGARGAEQAGDAALVGAMEGDHHHIGALCVRVLLERVGWRVAYLGPDVPVEDFAHLQDSRGARLVCISFTPPHAPADVQRALRILSEFYQPERPYVLALGGDGVGSLPTGTLESGPFERVAAFSSSAAFQEWLEETFPVLGTA